MKSLIIMAIAIFAITSCTPSFKTGLAPSNVVDEVAIVLKLGSKTGEWKMPFLKNKGNRRGAIKKLNKLHREALSLYQSQKMPSENYIEYTQTAELASQILWVVAAFESEEKVDAKVKDFYEQVKNGNYKSSNKTSSALLGKSIQTFTGNENVFDEFLNQATSAFDQYLAPYRNSKTF
jgi:hypothetical protein